MGHLVTGRGRNQRLKKQLFISSRYGVRTVLWDCGPHVRPDSFKRAISLMKRLESLQMTSHWVYAAARTIALRF